jgi:hypothetical protein
MIQPQILSELLEGSNLRAFAAFLLLKSKVKNSCLYNPTGSSVAAILGCSVATANRYLKQFNKLSWLYSHKNNTMLVKVSEITKRYTESDPEDYSKKARVYINLEGKKINDVVTLLNYLIIKQKELNKNFLLDLSQDLQMVKSSRAAKILIKKADKYNVRATEANGEIDRRLQISYERIAKLFKCSVGKAYNMMKKFFRLGYVKIYRKQEIILRRVPLDVWEDKLMGKKGYYKCHYAYGNVVRNHCNKYNLLA